MKINILYVDLEYVLMNKKEFYHDTPYTCKHCRIIKNGFNLLDNHIILEVDNVLFRNYVRILDFQFYECKIKHKCSKIKCLT